MGKRAILSYSLKTFPALAGPTPTYTNQGDFGFSGVSTSHTLNFEYVYHRRKTVCLIAQYSRTGVDMGRVSGFFYKGDLSKPAVMNSIGFGLALRCFRKAFFAPFGPYLKFEGMFFSNKVFYDENNWVFNYGSSSGKKAPPQGSGIISTFRFGGGVSVGKQRVFKDKFVFDRGLRLMIVPSGGFGNTQSIASVKEMLETQSGLRLMNHQFINFHIGIGFLAF